jgi:hypothetical protein
MRLLVLAIACQHRKLRQVEDLSKDLSIRARRNLGLRKRKVSDTALYERLVNTPLFGFRETLFAQLRRDLQGKAVTNDLFAGGVVTYDGKSAGRGYGEPPNTACRSTFFGKERRAGWTVPTLRASLTSSSTRAVLDMQFMTRRRGERWAFEAMFRRDVAQYPRLFRYVTADAGITSRHNADVVLEAGKHYLFALKENHRRLYARARAMLEGTPVVARTEERAQGHWVTRELQRASVTQGYRFPGAAQVWLVTETREPKAGEVKVGHRVYVTSIPEGELSDARMLKLVRLHWGIENGPNWTTDILFREDEHSPCKQGFGVAVMSWLNLLAYNLVSVFRAHLPKTRATPPPWGRVGELVYQALFLNDIPWAIADRV